MWGLEEVESDESADSESKLEVEDYDSEDKNPKNEKKQENKFCGCARWGRSIENFALIICYTYIPVIY